MSNLTLLVLITIHFISISIIFVNNFEELQQQIKPMTLAGQPKN